LPDSWAYLPIYQAAVAVSDLISAVLLFSQFLFSRSKALLVLACAYLFIACMAVIYGLMFPGLFAPNGLLGADAQSSAWVYLAWHGGFPVFVVAYAVMKDRNGGSPCRVRPRAAILVGVTLVFAMVATFVWVATQAEGALPPLVREGRFTSATRIIAPLIWALSLGALVTLCRRKPHSVLDIWLMVTMCAWLLELALSTLVNSGRFDLGFYVGRAYGLAAASFVLGVLLLEHGNLYARLWESHARERQRAKDIERVSAKLGAANRLLGQLNKNLHHSGRMKTEFLAHMSHELRTPLSAIIGFAECLKEGWVGELLAEQQRFATQIYDSGVHLLDLINDALDVSKVEEGRMTLLLEDVALDDFLHGCLSTLEEGAKRRGIELTYVARGGDDHVHADARKLRQILYNLLSNALKFTPDGGTVQVSWQVVDQQAVRPSVADGASWRVLPLPPQEAGELVEISVTDSGCGMPADQLHRLFERYGQIESPGSGQHAGTGLGLALVSSFAALHGGTVGVATTVGRGSRFLVWLPRRHAGMPHPPAEPPAATSAHPGLTRHVLVIEDDDAASDLLRLHLESAGFRVSRAKNAAEVGRFTKDRLDLVTLDLLLPDGDGWEVLERLRKDPARASVPVVIVSVAADRHKGFALGASKVLQKPVPRETLLACIESLGLGSRPAERYSVLVIDDDPVAMELMTLHLQAHNCNVLRAQDGQDAIRIAEESLPDLVILDLMMPGMSGFDVVEALQDEPTLASMPVIVVTAKAITAEDRQRLKGRVLSIVNKVRFDHEHFVAELHRALRTRNPAP
jgi:signal transduction histidine kinase/DNA-binding response OmpR family regulator